MIVWIFRAVALVGTPVITWLTVSKDLKGLALGVLIGLVIIGVEYVFENVSLFSLIIGIIGAVVGIILSKLLDYVVFQIGNGDFNDIWLRFNIVVRYALALLGDADMAEDLARSAERNYSAAIKAAPGNAETRYLRAKARLMLGDTGGAARDFLKFMSLSGKISADTAADTARTLYRAGQFPAALKFADAAASDSHADAAVFELRARIRHELGDREGALSDLRIFSGANPSAKEKSAKAAAIIRKETLAIPRQKKLY